MVESMKRKRKQNHLSLAEDGISPLLDKYKAETIMTLLQEVNYLTEYTHKVDWKKLVKESNSGISNPLEYQNLWKNLAYRIALPDECGSYNAEEGGEDGMEMGMGMGDDEEEGVDDLLDDDSDLESELEVYPAISAEESLEAEAFAKVLLASVLPSDSNLETAEAPLVINVPSDHSSHCSSGDPQFSLAIGKNLVVPVTIHVHQTSNSAAAISMEEGNVPATGSLSSRKKKKWTEEENMELISAVGECGEKNWNYIIQTKFNGERTPSQLAQKWSFIKKRNPNLLIGGSGRTSTIASSIISETQQANLATTRVSIESAMKMPVNRLSSTGTNGTPILCSPITPSETSNSIQSVGPKPKMPPTKSSTAPVPGSVGPKSIKQAAVAAGARIAHPSTAASLRKAAQSKNAVHIRSGGSNVIMPSISNSVAAGKQSGKPSNVHYMRSVLPSASTNYCSVTAISRSAKVKPADLSVGSSILSPMCIDLNGTEPSAFKFGGKELRHKAKVPLLSTGIVRKTQIMDDKDQTSLVSQFYSSVITSKPQAANSSGAELPVEKTSFPTPMCIDSNEITKVDSKGQTEQSNESGLPHEVVKEIQTIE